MGSWTSPPLREGLGDRELEKLGLDEVLSPLADKAAFTGAAQAQVADVVTAAEKLIARYPDAAQYAPAPIL